MNLSDDHLEATDFHGQRWHIFPQVRRYIALPNTTTAIHESAVFPEKMRVRKRILNNHGTA
jgi:hypothetical protein